MSAENAAGPFAGTDLQKDLGRNNPLPGEHYFDPSVMDLATSQANRGPAGYEGLLNYGLDRKTPEGRSADPMVAALQERFSGQVKDVAQGLRSNTHANAPAMASDERTKTGGEVADVYANEVRNFNEQYAFQVQRSQMLAQWKNAQAQAQWGLMGQIFSGLGNVATIGIAGSLFGGKK